MSTSELIVPKMCLASVDHFHFRHQNDVTHRLFVFCRMLQEDPVLFQLYKDLVVSQVISAEEFWANRLSLSSVDHSLSNNNNKQEVGISAAFLVSSRSSRILVTFTL